MKILHLNEHVGSVGGVEVYLRDLMPMQEAAGHSVHLAHGTEGDGVFGHQHRIRMLRSVRSKDIGPCREAVANLIDRVSPNVVHLHGVQNLGAIQAAVESGRAVMHGHDFRPICPASNFFYKRTKSICDRTCGPGCFGITALKHCMTPRPRPAWYVYRRVRWILCNATRFRHVIAPSGAARRRFLQAGFSSGQVTSLPYFCPLDPLRTPRPLPDHQTITFMGRASYTKGWEVFIEALSRLPATVHGLMVGNFGREGAISIRVLARKFGCGDRLEVEGWAGRDSVTAVYRRTTVFVFPSLWPETLGIVGIEALSQGVPVVASDVGGVREWLEHGRNGCLVPPNDAGALATVLAPLLTDEVRLQAMGVHGLLVVREKFAPVAHTRSLTRVYESLVGAHNGMDPSRVQCP